MAAHSATRGDLHASGILDCGQKNVNITLELHPCNANAESYESELSRDELCHAMGVHHQASEHLNLEQMNLMAVSAPLSGSHAFTIHQMDESADGGLTQLPTSVRAVFAGKDSIRAHHFIAPEDNMGEQVPLTFAESTHSSDIAKGSGVRRAARWTGWKSENQMSDQISTESIMRGVTTFKGANGEMVHAVPKSTGQQKLAANAGAMTKLCQINSDNKIFADQYLSNEVESEGQSFYVIGDKQVNELQSSLQSNLKPQFQLGDGLKFTATRFGGKNKNFTEEEMQQPLYATFQFSRKIDGEVSMQDALTNLEGAEAKVEYNETPSLPATALQSQLADKLDLHGATVHKVHQ